jgi:hypothetical protein
MERESDFFHTGTELWTGVCEARDDPAMMGRIRVRIFGFHSPDRTEIPTETLPWAFVMLPTTAGGSSGVMATTSSIIEGTWVIGFFRDGPSCQDPVVIGVLLGMSSPRWTGLSGSAPPSAIEQVASTLNTGSNDPLSQKEKLKTAVDEKAVDIFDTVKNAWDNLAGVKKFNELLSSYSEFNTADPDILKDAITQTQGTDKETINESKSVSTEVATDVKNLQPESLEALKTLTPEKQDTLKTYIEQQQ